MSDENDWLGDLPGVKDIQDAAGVTYPRRARLRFEGATVADDPVNGRTVVSVPGSGSQPSHEIVVDATDLPESETPGEYVIDASVYGGADTAQTRLTVLVTSTLAVHLPDDAAAGAEVEFLLVGNVSLTVARPADGTIDGSPSNLGVSALQTGGRAFVTLRCVDADSGAWVRTAARYWQSAGPGEVSPRATHALADFTIGGTSSPLFPSMLRGLVRTTSDSTVTLSLGTEAEFSWSAPDLAHPVLYGVHLGTGDLQISPAGGVTVHGNTTISGPNKLWRLQHIGTDTWILSLL